ncbi:hypothetical protein [Pseudomaricurvus sp. HS19]|uniref:hypothetical protein n=1 Tax=Pseudomaricurvus sp. HS19 TaxID=2692626 RepID=UPI00136E54AF|nr:hypothetical protein [Pseudomaricurvus sp. HS19]MYM62836.1 hypothetical protein [Pseudomaricurvus sp. HS19]
MKKSHRIGRPFGRLIATALTLVPGLWQSAALADPPASLAVYNGRAGFVVTTFSYVLGPDADEAGTCPRGMAKNLAEIYALEPDGRQQPGEPDAAYTARVRQAVAALATLPDGNNVCLHPEAAPADPHFRTVTRSDIPVDGVDLDGKGADSGDYPADDFTSPEGVRGIDNQFYRVVGCSRSFQSTGPSNTFGTEMLTGAWGILVTLEGIDDLHNDDAVTVGIYANADPIQLSAAREPLGFATYAMDQDPRFRATTSGVIRDGVLYTEPVDIRFHSIVNSLRLERPLRHARLQVTLGDDAGLQGFLAGYTPIEAMYDMQYGYRSGRGGDGKPGPLKLRLGTANGAAFVLGHTCNGGWQALHQLADGDCDGRSGECTSISTQYRLQAIPAFVVDAVTASSNAELEKAERVDVY